MSRIGSLLTFAIIAASAAEGAGVPAFPGAEGFGSRTPGGRGGRVIHVTTLDDGDGPGTFRHAITATGPRTVVFDVGGTIRLQKSLYVKGEERAYLTVAGQTAPGGGICISNAPFVFTEGVHDVVLRHLRIRTGDKGPSREPDALALNSVSNVVVDHCSVSWGVDEVLSITAFPEQKGNAHDITIQWCIVSEGLHRSTHHKGAHSKGLMVAYGPTRVTLHHNLIMHCNDRNPYLPTEGEFPYIIDVVNNVVYNWGAHAGIGYRKTNHNGRINFAGNYYIKGPNSRTRPCLTMGVNAQIHARGNIGPVRTSLDQDEWKAIAWNPKGGARQGVRSERRFDAPKVETHSHADAYDLVLRRAGAISPRRDAADTRLISEVKTRSGKIINHPEDVGGWPDLARGVPPADTDQDGMPDEWEKARGLDPDDRADGRADRDDDGYTNVEEYLNGLVGPP